MKDYKRIVVTVTGPSASGKTELVHKLVESYNFDKLVSVTTRRAREGEVAGKDYYFINDEAFNDLVTRDQLVQQVNFRGVNYGTTKEEIERAFSSKSIPIVIVEPGGVDQFREIAKDMDFVVYSIFVHAPHRILEDRYLRRIQGSITDYDKQRLVKIKEEAETWYNTQPWSIVFNNPGDDISSISWFCDRLVADLDCFIASL